MLYYSIVGIFKPKTIVKIIQSIDYIAVFKQTEEFDELSAELNVDPEEFDKLMKDKAVGRLFADFAAELSDKMFDPNAKLEDIDAPVFKSLIDEHIDGILPIIEQKNGAPVDKEEARQELHKFIDENPQQLTQTVMSLQPVKEQIMSYSTVTENIYKSLKWYNTLLVWLVEAGVLALIYLMRKRNFGGFIWIAVDTGILGLLTSGAAALVGSGLIKNEIEGMKGFAGAILGSSVDMVSSKFVTALICSFLVMAAAIVACVLLRKRAAAKALAAAQTETLEIESAATETANKTTQTEPAATEAAPTTEQTI